MVKAQLGCGSVRGGLGHTSEPVQGVTRMSPGRGQVDSLSLLPQVCCLQEGTQRPTVALWWVLAAGRGGRG